MPTETTAPTTMPAAVPLPTSIPTPAPSPTPQLTIQPLPEVPEGEQVSLIIYKADRRLEVWAGELLLAVYPVGLGWAPEGHKQLEGDGKTPEGVYYISMKNPNSDYYKSMWVSYPNIEDAQTGYKAGMITQGELQDITAAIEAGQRPKWTTSLGGAIALHGGGSGRDWTAGCIALENEVIDMVWAVCSPGIPVTILP